MAKIWSLVDSFNEGDIPDEEQAVKDRALWKFIQESWTGEYGKLPASNQRAINSALRLFGAMDVSAGIFGGLEENGQIGLNDGRHRSCVARRLGIVVGVFLEVEAQKA